MENFYGDLISAKEYAESLRNGGYIESENTMITASEYAKSLSAASSARVDSPFITVQDYVKALDMVKYSTESDKEIEEKIEKSLFQSNKAKVAAQKLEQLLA